MLALKPPHPSHNPIASPRRGVKVPLPPPLSATGLISSFPASFATQGALDRGWGSYAQREGTGDLNCPSYGLADGGDGLSESLPLDCCWPVEQDSLLRGRQLVERRVVCSVGGGV